MKKALCIVSLLGGVAMADSQTITKSGELGGFEGNAQNFSGKVKVSMMFKTEPWREMIGALVEFDKNARSAWHTHTAGQTLIITEGEILTKVPGEKASIAKKGDVISCPPDVRHFHGATDKSAGSHIAITQEKNGKNTNWLELVSDAEYKEALSEARRK